MSLFRIPLLLTTAVCVQKSLSPPTPTVSATKRVRQEGLLERIIMFDGSGVTVLWIKKLFAWAVALAESGVVLARTGAISNDWRSRILAWLTGSPVEFRGHQVAGTLPIALVAGSMLAVAGTSFRLAAYRALDRQFTYQLTLKDDHQLVKSYPYNIVRHPSYTGWFVCAMGLGLASLTSDGWIRSVVIPAAKNATTGTRIAAMAWVTTAACSYALSTSFLLARISTEDSMLKERFGKEWETWSTRVPYRLIPWVW